MKTEAMECAWLRVQWARHTSDCIRGAHCSLCGTVGFASWIMVAERECWWGKGCEKKKKVKKTKKRMNMNTNRKLEKDCMCKVAVKYTIHLARLTTWKLRKMTRIKQRILISLFKSSWKTSSRFGFSSAKQFERCAWLTFATKVVHAAAPINGQLHVSARAQRICFFFCFSRSFFVVSLNGYVY